MPMVQEKPLKIMTEASGSLVSAYMLKAIRAAGHIPVGSDITPWTPALALADEHIIMPSSDDPGLWAIIEEKLAEHHIDIVIPSLDKTLLGWAERRAYFAARQVCVIISPPETVAVFADKWFTHQFFTANNIPCPAASLRQEYPLLKPRAGSGAKGIFFSDTPVDMAGHISQALATGSEYTVDCLFDLAGKPVYIVPRRRAGVKDGKSTQGEVADVPGLEQYIRRMSETIPFNGPVNFQLFRDDRSGIQFIECNPRIAGGMALSFAATENWVPLMVRNFMENEPIQPKPIRFGTRMIRYYAEHFVYPY